jgi:RNA-directed DNA polymerase
MSGDVHVRICERLGVQLPRATRLVAIFAAKEDAERVLRVLEKRMGKYGLQLHPDKTHLVDFRPKTKNKPPPASAETALATTFQFLGFLHVWGKSRKGNAVVWQHTAKERFARALKAINKKCQRMRHEPLPDQHRQLSQMLQGHMAYFGISGNFQRIAGLIRRVRRQWRFWLSRRSNASHVTWEAYERIAQRFPLPRPRIVHRYTAP